MKAQVGWVYKSLSSSNETAPIVNEYFTRKMLAKMGMSFNVNDLDDFDIEAFSFIQSEWNRLENAELKRKAKR